MAKHKKIAALPYQQQLQQLTPEQLQQQQMEERLQVYRLELRTAKREEILQRMNQKR
jgi:hypothetical protein